MQLAEIFSAREAWARLTQLRIPPQKAYKLLKYVKLVGAEADVVEQQRIALIQKVSGAKPGDNVSLERGTPEHRDFVVQFGAVLATETDLKPIEMTLEDLLGSLGADQANVLSVEDMARLEPFFKS